MYSERMIQGDTDFSMDEIERPPTPEERTSSAPKAAPRKWTETRVLIIGPSGVGKTSLVNMLSNERLKVGSEGMGLCTTRFWSLSKPVMIDERPFRLIDSPGFNTNTFSNADVLKQLVAFLAKANDKYHWKLSGVLYLHPEGDDLACEQLKQDLEALTHLFGEPWLPNFTFAIVGSDTTVESDVVHQLQAPSSPFYPLHEAGAKCQYLPFELSHIQNVISEFDPVPTSDARFYSRVRWSPYSRGVGVSGLDLFMDEILGSQRTTSIKKNRVTLEESESSRQQLQATLEAVETELKSIRGQLEQTQLEYASLRSELQLNDNTEQSKIVQSVQDLNRAIDDFGRSVAECMVDNVAPTLDKEDPTTLDASDFAELQRQLGHQDGISSLVASSKGEGLPIEDLIDLALRSFLCQKLCKDVFIPFHPTLATSAVPGFMASLYEEVRRQGPPFVASKWRASSFIALSKGGKLDKATIESQVESFVAEDIQPLLHNLFGQNDAAALTENHRSQLQDIVTAAWKLNHVLKGEVVTLGDFQPQCYEGGTPFDRKTMIEFEPDKKRGPGDVVICTIRLGLALSYSRGAGKDAGHTPTTNRDGGATSSTSTSLHPSPPKIQPTMRTDDPPKPQQHSGPNRRGRGASAQSRQLSYRGAPGAKQTRGEATSPTVNQGSSASPANSTKQNATKLDSAKPKEEVAPVPILILGAQGCGKSSLVNAAFGKPVREISNGFELGTTGFHFNSLSDGKHNFMLVDSPGFDNASMSDAEVMTMLVQFLCCGKTPAKMAGVIYLHTQDTRLGSGILRRNLYLIKSLLGDSFMDRLTVLLVPRPGEQADHQELVRPLLDPKSPFYPLYESGAQFDVSPLETQSIRNVLLSYAQKTPALMSVQDELCSKRAPNDNDINTYLMKCARARESGLVATRPKITAGGLFQVRASSSNQHAPGEVKKLQLELAESKKQSDGVSSQLQQQLDQYTALRSQLQINENVEQRDIVQNLIDLNRRIEDLALSLSQHLVDTYGDKMTTTRNAFELPKLKELFEHEEGRASLVLSSKGAGVQLEDFLDVAIRSILCEQIYKRIIGPFHPGLELSDARNKHVLAIYGRIRDRESQATLGRWRTACFTAISGLIGEQELSNLRSKAGPNILNENVMPMLKYIFGARNARPKGAHAKEFSEIATQAWDWCVTLKEKIVLLGDFQPTAYRYGAAFETALMTEFEPRPGSQPPARILSTIGLGLNVFRGQSSGEGSDRVILRQASVVTEGWFERS
ncbi:unnamed protein product [Rhizoctonia solani]|uniref:G domain-containing protein n=1 Tax=Rhizoctonia solani TaxID=456999 RepID=A0A8H3HD88_9AGAM|nr:unnamed protein product [Rhizoctonia solani]